MTGGMVHLTERVGEGKGELEWPLNKRKYIK